MATSQRAKEFARLVDLAVDHPGTRVARELASDEQVAAMVATAHQLRGLRLGVDADPQFRARLRRRLVAVASVNPPEAATRHPVPVPRMPLRTTLAGTAAGNGSRPARGRHQQPQSQQPRSRSPRLAFLAGALAALVLVSGLTLLASTRALPGDTLYAIKRSSEQFELALMRDPAQRALRQLSFAQTRLAEVGQLVGRRDIASLDPRRPDVAGPSQLTDTGAGLVARALQDMDADTRQGASQLTSYAVQRQSDPTLATMAGWTADQRGGLTSLLGRLPEPTATRAKSSLTLLEQIQTRLRLLRAELPCACLNHATADDIGPVPCSPCTPHPGQTSSTAPTAPRQPGTSGSGTPAPHRSVPPTGRSGADHGGPLLPPLPLPVLPSLPTDPNTGFPPLLPPLFPL
jgi:hypothetical protein